MLKKIAFTAFSVLLVLPAYSQNKDCIQPYRSPFRYFVIGNKVYTGNPNDSWRDIDVLLDDKSFSEATLRHLFQLLSKRFPKPVRFDVWVYTSLEVAPTLEEAEQPGMSEVRWCDEGLSDKFHWALYVRTKENEFFRYNPNPPKPDLRTVVLRGSAP